MEVGIRALRADLSRRLKLVGAGEANVVTDRGKPVAKITRANGRSRLNELVARGLVQPAPTPMTGALPASIKARGTVSDLVRG